MFVVKNTIKHFSINTCGAHFNMKYDSFFSSMIPTTLKYKVLLCKYKYVLTLFIDLLIDRHYTETKLHCGIMICRTIKPTFLV
jgi:hypothetical protein